MLSVSLCFVAVVVFVLVAVVVGAVLTTVFYDSSPLHQPLLVRVALC